MAEITYTSMDSPLGKILLVRKRDGLCSIRFATEAWPSPLDASWQFVEEDEAVTQLQAYFEGQRQTFDLPLVLEGTPFQKKIWAALQEIPYGNTLSYAVLAERIDQPQAVRAVGAANGKNPLPIVVPCHRVIGSNGTLTGYAGGLPIKKALLDLECQHVSKPGKQPSLFNWLP